MLTALQGSNDANSIFEIQKVYWIYTSICYFILLWDWLSHIPAEIVVFRTSQSYTGIYNIFSLKHLFFVSRYLTIAWCTFVVATWGALWHYPNICSWFQYYTYGYSIVLLSAHFIMILRIHSIYNRNNKVLAAMMALMLIDFGLQMGAGHWVNSVLLITESPRIVTCFNQPSSYAYIIVFLSPTVFHHVILLLTLWKSIAILRKAKEVGVQSIMGVIQRDHIAYVLIICLVNFANVILVAQKSLWPYRLINQLPAAVFTQLFLSRIVFNLKFAQLSLSASQTPSSVTPFTSFGLGGKSRFNGSGGQNSSNPQRSGDSEDLKAGLSSGSLTLGGSRRGSNAQTTLPRYPQPIGSLTNSIEHVDLYGRRKGSLKSDKADVINEKYKSPTTPTRSKSQTARAQQISQQASANNNSALEGKMLSQTEQHSRLDSDDTCIPSYPLPHSPAPEYASPLSPNSQPTPRTHIPAFSPIFTGRRGSEPARTTDSSPFSNFVNKFAQSAAPEGDIIEIKQLQSPILLQAEQQNQQAHTTLNSGKPVPMADAVQETSVAELNRFRFPSNASTSGGRHPSEHAQRHFPGSLPPLNTSAQQHVTQDSAERKRQSSATIDDDVKELDWQPPSQWNSGESGRMSPPMAYSVRGLEASLGTRGSLSATSPLASATGTSAASTHSASPHSLAGHRIDIPAASYDDLIHIKEGETPPDAPKANIYARDADARSQQGIAQ